MQFGNPIVGGNTLIRDDIQSQNYLAGAAGWIISKLGTAEFNQVTIRGALTVGGTQLYYNGTPALGNLIASISDSTGTDTYGNTYLAGISSYDIPNHNYTNMFAGSVKVGQINPLSGVPDLTNAMSIINSGSSGNFTTIDGPAPVGVAGANTIVATLERLSRPRFAVTDKLNSAPADITVSGAIIRTDNAGNVATNQTPGSFGTGWAIGPAAGTVQNLYYRQGGEDNVKIEGAIHSTSTTPATTLFNIPTGYIPAAEKRGGVLAYDGTNTTVHGIRVTTTGAIIIFPAVTATNTDLYFEMDYPLGNVT